VYNLFSTKFLLITSVSYSYIYIGITHTHTYRKYLCVLAGWDKVIGQRIMNTISGQFIRGLNPEKWHFMLRYAMCPVSHTCIHTVIMFIFALYCSNVYFIFERGSISLWLWLCLRGNVFLADFVMYLRLMEEQSEHFVIISINLIYCYLESIIFGNGYNVYNNCINLNIFQQIIIDDIDMIDVLRPLLCTW